MRDRLPALAAGRLDDALLDETRAHVAACADCAAELELVRTLRAHTVPVPSRLEARVRATLEARPARGGWWSPGRVAMAATVVFALITAGLLTDRAGEDRLAAGDPPPVTAEDAASDLADPLWPAVDEPLMRDGPALHELSVEELETLLEELES